MLSIAVHVQNLVVLLTPLQLLLLPSGNAKRASLRIAAAWLLILGAFGAGVWYHPHASVRYWIAAVLLTASAIHVRRAVSADAAERPRFARIVAVASLGVGLVLVWQATAGRLQPDGLPVIDLAPPLRTATNHCVLSGGNTYALNLHFLTSQGPEGLYEKHSVDFVQHDEHGNRTKGLTLHTQPEAISSYLIFDEPVLAPCAGEVIERVDARPDHPAGNAYRDRSGSNYVTLRCGNTDVVMAHLKQHAVAVALGDQVRIGELIGLVGHSGNSEEPHLHLNAQTIVGDGAARAFPQPVVMTFEGRYLAAGDCL